MKVIQFLSIQIKITMVKMGLNSEVLFNILDDLYSRFEALKRRINSR